jgi:iron complex outermembrane receptor protein
MIRNRKRVLLAAVAPLALGGFGVAAPVMAQDETGASAATETIVVTARRRAENLQQTPVAVSAFTSNTLERRQIAATTDLDKVTPSLQFTSYGQLSGNNSAAVVFIRGIGQLDPTPAVDPGVGIYIDDVYMGRSVGGALDFGDIENVQVLRGPQGVLFGRNTIGGAVLVTTRRPSDELEGRVRFKVGEDNLVEAFGSVNMPLAEGLAARIALGGRMRDGYVTRVFDGQDLGDENVKSAQGSLLWDVTPDFSILLRGDYTNEDENGSPFVFKGVNEQAPVAAIVSVAAGCPGATIPFAPIPVGDPRRGPPNVPMIDDPRCANDFYNLGPYTNGGNAPVKSTFNGGGVSATAEWRVSDALSLKSITGYRDIEWAGIRDADNTPLTLITTDYTSRSEQFSEELQAQLDFGRLTGVAGLYYFDEASTDRVTVPLAFPPSPPVIGSLLAGGPGSRDLQHVELTTESAAAFTGWTFDLSDALSISGGLRYTDETKGFQGTVMNLFPATLPDPNPLPTLATSEGGPLFVFSRPFEQSFSALTGSASAQYEWTDNIMTYVSFSQGFKSGGFNQRYNAPPPGNLPVAFDEETVETWELGFKTDLSDTLRVNGAAFMSQYTDIQLIYRQGVVPLLFNAGDASIDGFELEFSWAPISDLIVDGGMSYLDDSFDSIRTFADPGISGDVTLRSSLPMTPEWQANLGAAYTMRLGSAFELIPQANVSYTDAQYFDVANTPLVAQSDGVVVADAAMRLRSMQSGWEFTLGVENLSDELYPVQGNASLATLGYAEMIYARPRSWYLGASYDF